MVWSRRSSVVALPLAAVFALSGCSLLQTPDAVPTLSPIAACASGKTWSLDLPDLATQLTTILKAQGVPVTKIETAGSQKFLWGPTGEVNVTSDYTITLTANPAADQTIVLTQTHKGDATGKAFADADVAVPRDWDATGFAVKTASTLNGKAQDKPPYVIPRTDFDDEVGIELTCTGSTLTTHPRGMPITQKWTTSG
jgi:hypothetical protein